MFIFAGILALTLSPADSIAFVEIQEDWVIAGLSDDRRVFATAFPRKDARLLRMLGCGHSDCREVAAEALRDRGAEAVRLLVWGTHSRDAQVAATCADLLRPFRRCGQCMGFGSERVGQPWYISHWEECGRCHGTGQVPAPTEKRHARQ